MIFFRRKKPEPSPAPKEEKKAQPKISQERILTAEGWRRLHLTKARKSK